MIQYKLKSFVSKRCCTLLGVGPVSKNCVDASIELANDYEIPIFLIASRGQIDSEELGGGYVNNWSTESFAEYVIDQDKKGKIIMARDHGGPWQNEHEKTAKLSLRKAMASAKKSYRTDIEAGFEAIHIDPSVDIFGNPSLNDILQRVYELYEYCWTIAQQNGQDIIFEIGTEEQSGSTNSQEKLEYVLEEIFRFCKINHLPNPTFVVTQTGTRVMETRNIGSFDSPIRVANEIPAEIQVPKIIEICNRHKIFMKQHNTDYLSDETLSYHPKLGIHSANVAPEFGVIETKTFLNLLRSNNLNKLYDSFIELAFESNKWQKWMLPETKASETERAIIAGHYLFSNSEIIEIKRQAQSKLKSKNIIIDDILKDSVKQSILRYLKHFRLVNK